MSGQEITISATDGGKFMGYLAVPIGGNGPGVVVIQEIFWCQCCDARYH